MTREETIALMKKMDASFPTWKPKDLQEVVNIWAECMDDIEYKYAERALMNYIKNDVTGFAPTVGVIRLKAKEYYKADSENGLRYWMMRVKSIYPYEFKCTHRIEENDGERFYWFVRRLIDLVETNEIGEDEVSDLDALIVEFYKDGE